MMSNFSSYRGTIEVRKFDVKIKFQLIDREMLLLGDIRISDVCFSAIALELARYLKIQVIWQDICGLRHFVNPEDSPYNHEYSLDPRDSEFTHLVLC